MGAVDGKRIVITGASRGLGRGFAVALAEAGARVVINGTNAEHLAATARAIADAGGVSASVVGTVADDAVCEEIVATCVERFGGIDVAVNNAGVAIDRTLLKMTPEEFDMSVAVNLRGSWSVSRHAVKAMVAAGTGGHLLHITSIAAFIGSIGQSNYAAAKAGQLGLMYAWSSELSRYGIRVNALSPGAATDMTQVVFDNVTARAVKAGKPAPTPHEMGFGTPETVAPLVVFLCSDAAAHIDGQLMTFNGRKLAVWRHAKERVHTTRDHWDVADFATDFPEPLQNHARSFMG
jgi:3-oxoacyl-[acyl-carrier protein] reductase